MQQYPFTSLADAREYVRKHPRYACFGVIVEGREYFGLRAAGSSDTNTLQMGALDDTPAVATRAGPLRKGERAATSRKQQVLEMLLEGPVTVTEIVARYACTPAAATALISDVRRMGHTVNRVDANTYVLA